MAADKMRQARANLSNRKAAGRSEYLRMIETRGAEYARNHLAMNDRSSNVTNDIFCDDYDKAEFLKNLKLAINRAGKIKGAEVELKKDLQIMGKKSAALRRNLERIEKARKLGDKREIDEARREHMIGMNALLIACHRLILHQSEV